MKVVQIITRVNQGGTARWLENLTHGLMEAGWKSVLVAGEVGENEVEDSCFKTLQGIKVQSLGKGKGPISDIRSFFYLRKIIKTEKPDIVNTHTSKAGVLGRLAAWSILVKRPKILHTYHGHLLYGYFSRPVTILISMIEKSLSGLTDQFIAAGTSVRDELIDSGIGSINQYSIVKPGVIFKNEVDKDEVRRKLHIANDAIVVGWMGRFEPIKSPKRVVELAEFFPQVTFLMAGSGSLFDQIDSIAPRNLLLPGWCDANQIWSASDIALLTSENEALPIALIEAGLTGIPAVAEDVGAVSEVICHLETGFLCESFEARKQALLNLLENRDLRIEMGECARKYCVSQFSQERFIKDHIEIYERTISK